MVQCRIAALDQQPHRHTMTTVAERLQSMGITLPPLAVPAAAYVPFVRSGNLVFISGHIAKQNGKPWVGQLGLTMATAEARPRPARSRSICSARWRPRAAATSAASGASSRS